MYLWLKRTSLEFSPLNQYIHNSDVRTGKRTTKTIDVAPQNWVYHFQELRYCSLFHFINSMNTTINTQFIVFKTLCLLIQLRLLTHHSNWITRTLENYRQSMHCVIKLYIFSNKNNLCGASSIFYSSRCLWTTKYSFTCYQIERGGTLRKGFLNEHG